MFCFDDMLVRLGLSPGKTSLGREMFREEAANIQRLSREEITKIFPNATLSDSKEIVYAPFKLCHSLPKVNIRGRCFTPTVLHNSFASVRDALVNVDHQMKFRGSSDDTICGHIVCGRFDPDGKYLDETASKNETPIPLMALAAFYLRSQYVRDFLEEHLSKKRAWHTSMECAHDYANAAFLYRGDFIPVKDADEGMRECVEKNRVKPYKGHTLALALGGETGSVDFHSAAITPQPADKDAKMLAFVTKDEYVEAANSGEKEEHNKTKFYFPLETKVFQNKHAADETANVSVIGQTAEADGHVHDILSDGTIVPANGHTHSMATFGLVRGTNPKLTGRTDLYYEYVRSSDGAGYGRDQALVHMHLIDVPLKGKGTPAAATDTSETANDGDQQVVPYVPDPFLVTVEVPDMKLTELFSQVDSVLANGKFEGQLATDVASLRKNLAVASRDDIIKDAVKTELASLVKTGEIVTKEAHESEVAAKLKEATEKAAKDAADQKIINERREKVIGLGLTMDDKFDDKIDMTVGDYVGSFALDDKGGKLFDVAFAQLKTIADLTKEPEADEAAVAAAAAAAKAAADKALTGTETTAANKGGKAAKPKKAAAPPARKLLLVGGGKTDDEANDDEEEENEDEEANEESDEPTGRHIFSKPIR